MNLFDAEQARDQAIQQVEDNADTDWMRQALAAVKWCAHYHGLFTTDEVWTMLPEVREPRALGAVMRKAQKAGWIRPTDRVRNSSRVECHARPVRVWESA